MLKQYEDKILALDDDERRAYFREDYDEDSEYIEPEYGDFTNAWKYDFEYNACKYISDFVRHELAESNSKMMCGDHYHWFKVIPNVAHMAVNQKSITVFLTPETKIDTETCWYKVILNAIHHLRDEEIDGLMELTECQKRLFYGVVVDYLKEKPTIKEQKQLNYAFERICFNGIDNQVVQINTLVDKVGYVGTQKVIAIANEVRQHKPVDPLGNVNRLLRTSGSIETEHGFHAFIRNVGDPRTMVNAINKTRTKAHNSFWKKEKERKGMNSKSFVGLKDPRPNEHVRIKYNVVVESMNTCIKCRRHDGTRMSAPGIYYAPPGSGKTTVLDEEYLVAMDTDWLCSGLNIDMVKLFLNMGYPLITNQYNAFYGAPIKMMMFMNIEKMRKMENGKYFTEPDVIKEYARCNKNQSTLMRGYNNVYLAHRMLQMRIANYLSGLTVKQFLTHHRSGPST